jgi:hypothetical protein
VVAAIGTKLGSRRQAILFAVLALVLVLAVVRWGPGKGAAPAPVASASVRPKPGGDPTGDEAPAAARGRRAVVGVKEVNPDDVPLLEAKDFEAGKPRGSGPDTGRDLFGLSEPTKRPQPTPTPAPLAPGDVRFVGPLPPPPPTPTPKPPDIAFKFLGTFGPKDHPIAVVQQGDQVMNVRTGDTLFGKFILRKVGYESIDVGFVGFPEAETRRLGITP